jgi:hypothetical protein
LTARKRRDEPVERGRNLRHARVCEHFAVRHHADRPRGPWDAPLHAAEPPDAQQAGIDLLFERRLAEHRLDVGEVVERGEGRQPALLQLRHVERLVRAHAQDQVLLHLRPGKTDEIEPHARIGAAEGFEHLGEHGPARGLVWLQPMKVTLRACAAAGRARPAMPSAPMLKAGTPARSERLLMVMAITPLVLMMAIRASAGIVDR